MVLGAMKGSFPMMLASISREGHSNSNLNSSTSNFKSDYDIKIDQDIDSNKDKDKDKDVCMLSYRGLHMEASSCGSK